ncbi:MAG: hypothetical protein ABII00_04680 [Elusimicrobiota bacterium]
MRPPRAISILLAAFLAASAAWGPRPARAAFDDLGAGGRAPGMGNAFTAIADDVYAVYYNPAGLAQLERPQISTAYSRFYMGLSDGSDLGLSQITYAHPLKNWRWGTLGGAWQRFALDDLYSEQSVYLSWGRCLWLGEAGDRLLGGLSAKYLRRSFQQRPEAYNALDQLTATGQPDPVLTGDNAAGAFDADIGLIYRLPRRFQLGLMTQHVLRPNVAFAGSDKLPRNLRLGIAYKSLWMNLAGELRVEPSPTGSTDRDVILAAERFIPSLNFGQLGLRGSLGFGSRQWRQISAGLSYRINKIQADYAFLMPLGTVKGTAGTHRVGLSLHFGAPAPDEEVAKDLLLQARRMREDRGPGYAYEAVDALRTRDLTDPGLKDVRLYIRNGEYRKGHRALVERAKELPTDVSIMRLSTRLALVAYYYPELSAPEDNWEVKLSSAIQHFLYGRDRLAILFGSYVLNLRAQDPRLNQFVGTLEETIGIKADRLPPKHPRAFLSELLFRVETAYNLGQQERVLSLLQDVLTLEPDDATALERVGTTYYVLGRYRDALELWERALPLEKSDEQRRILEEYIAKARRNLRPAAAKPAEERPAEAEPPPEAKRPEPERPKAARRADPRDVQKLYQKGVEHYARGEYLQATAMFMRILQIDPDNAQAKKALERLRRKQ